MAPLSIRIENAAEIAWSSNLVLATLAFVAICASLILFSFYCACCGDQDGENIQQQQMEKLRKGRASSKGRSDNERMRHLKGKIHSGRKRDGDKPMLVLVIDGGKYGDKRRSGGDRNRGRSRDKDRKRGNFGGSPSPKKSEKSDSGNRKATGVKSPKKQLRKIVWAKTIETMTPKMSASERAEMSKVPDQKDAGMKGAKSLSPAASGLDPPPDIHVPASKASLAPGGKASARPEKSLQPNDVATAQVPKSDDPRAGAPKIKTPAGSAFV